MQLRAGRSDPRQRQGGALCGRRRITSIIEGGGVTVKQPSLLLHYNGKCKSEYLARPTLKSSVSIEVEGFHEC
jgi:hypothetical protein